MPVFVVYGFGVFSTAARRDKVAAKAQTAATSNGFTPSGRVPLLPAGTVSYSYTAQPGESDVMVAGTAYPAVSVCYEHTDQAKVAEAELAIQDEMGRQGWLTGSCGTWTDVSG